MSYKTFIEEIINARGRFGIPEGEYKERHHVTPKCLGGEDTEDNLIDLYAREHYEAHKLLAIENPDNDKLGLAYAMMAFCVSSTQERYELSALEYEQARIIFSKSRIGHEVSIEARDKIGKSHRGRKWYTNGITDVLCFESEVQEGFVNGRSNIDYDAIAKKNRESKKKYGWYTNGVQDVQCREEDCLEGFIKGRSFKLCGEDNPFYGKYHLDESKAKMSETKKLQHRIPSNAFQKGHEPWNKGKQNLTKCTLETRNKLSKVAKDKIWCNNGEINKRVYKEDIPEGFVEGRLPFKHKDGNSDETATESSVVVPTINSEGN